MTKRNGLYGPWQCKQRPAGDWVIDQLDRETLKVRRFGTFQTEAEAREIYAVLTSEVSPNNSPQFRQVTVAVGFTESVPGQEHSIAPPLPAKGTNGRACKCSRA